MDKAFAIENACERERLTLLVSRLTDAQLSLPRRGLDHRCRPCPPCILGSTESVPDAEMEIEWRCCMPDRFRSYQ